MSHRFRRAAGYCLFALIPISGLLFSSEYGEPTLYAQLLQHFTR